MDPEELPLRDIHLPDPIPWWPPAIGWWVVLAVVIAVVLGLLLWYWRRRGSRIVRKARTRLDAIEAAYGRHGDPQVLARELSRLARQIAVTVSGRKEAAALTGDEWMRYLDQWHDDSPFTQGPGSVLKDAPYQRPGSLDSEALLQTFRSWLERIPRRAEPMGR